VVIQPLKLANEVSEGAGGNANGLAFLQIKAKLNVALSIGEIEQALHHAVGDWLRFSSLHKQTLYSQCAIDAAPAVSGSIEDHKNIAWEQRRGGNNGAEIVSTLRAWRRFFQ
jgi:hypothetical protein